ncbi:MAG: MFS transporter [Nitrososphaeria archaeon]|nr:MFS transporter [Conexivisphaerales archaeon]
MEGSGTKRLAALTIPFFASSMVVYSLLYKAIALSAALGVPASYVEATMSYSFYGGAVGGIALGYVADRFGHRKAMVLAALIYSVASMVAPFARSLASLSLLWAVVGFGVNAENGITYALVVKMFRASRGAFGGFIQGLYFVGMSADALLSIFLRNVYAYFFLIGILGILTAILFMLLPKSEPYKQKNEGSVINYPKRLILGSLISFSAFFYTIVLVTFIPLFVKGYMITVLSLEGFMCFLIFGYLSDLFNRSAVSLGLQLVGVLFIFFAITKAVNLSFAFAGLYLATSFFSYLGVWLGEFFPEKVRATGINASLFVGRLVGGLGPLIVGYFGGLRIFYLYMGSLLSALLIGIVSSLLIMKALKRENIS